MLAGGRAVTLHFRVMFCPFRTSTVPGSSTIGGPGLERGICNSNDRVSLVKKQCHLLTIVIELCVYYHCTEMKIYFPVKSKYRHMQESLVSNACYGHLPRTNSYN